MSAQAGAYTPIEAVIGIVGALVFGLCWGWVAFRASSIRWAAASHILVNLALLSATAFVG